MKRSKILIPTLSALAVTPAIALVGCGNKNSTEQSILDAIFSPIKTSQTPYPEATFVQSFKAMSLEDMKKELIYDIFRDGFIEATFDSNTKSIADFYNDNEGSFKINITKCNIIKNGDDFEATFLGYISYVFEKQHEITTNEQKLIFNANDYLMITYDFTNVKIEPIENGLGYRYEPTYGTSLGFTKAKFESGAKEALFEIGVLSTMVSHSFSPTNSKNWVKK